MLKNIKNMINQKTEYLEAAQILFEGVTESNIDNLIVLGESADFPKEDENDDDKLGGEGDELEDKDDPIEDNKDNKDDLDEDDGDLNNLPLDDEDDLKDDLGSGEDKDILDSSIEDEEIHATLTDTDDLPTPVGKQTGEPISDDIDDFLNITIDLKSNTITDVLPVPPSNAGEALADDILATRVDSGFGEDANADAAAAAGFPMEEESDPKKSDDALKESADSFLEAITLDGGTDAGDGASTEKPADGTEPAPADGTGAEVPPEGQESEVTTAVKDKVAEADTPIDAAGAGSGKEDLLKKLGSITKSLEDAKKAVMNTIQ